MDSSSHANETGGPMKYLTVQDMIWINLQITKKVHHFNYARLEEATFYQYGYGSSRDLAGQAGRFLGGFMKLHPFDAGNEATALIGCAAFLLMNGHKLRLPDKNAAEWVDEVLTGSVRGEEVLGEMIEEGACHESNVHACVEEALAAFPKTLQALFPAGDERLAG